MIQLLCARIFYNRFNEQVKKAMFGAGCFWCVEDDFRSTAGVLAVTSGYSGGNTENPTYEDVCRGDTNHAERLLKSNLIQISYPIKIWSISSLRFMINAQQTRSDVGTQYRSVIFYYDQQQKQVAEKVIETLTRGNKFSKPIVTEVSPVQVFYRAEENIRILLQAP
ncbi:MAG: peptide-methionine (S)-S-oxide reductase MsrA [Bdellovibrionota bacterium]